MWQIMHCSKHTWALDFFFIGLSVEGTFIVLGTGTLSDVPNDFHIIIVIVCVGVPTHSTKWKQIRRAAF